MLSCVNCERSIPDGAAACQNCGYKIVHASRSLTLHRPSPAAPITRHISGELAVTVDRTGSTKAFEKGIPLILAMLFQTLAPLVGVIKVWLQAHGDLDEGQNPLLLTDGGTPEQALQDLQQIQYGGGGGVDASDPEHHCDGVATLMNTIPWTSDPTRARGAIIAFCTADSKPLRSGQTARELGEEIVKRRLVLYLVCQKTPVLMELATAAHAMVFEITNTPKIDELQKIAAPLAASIAVTVQRGSTVPITAPAHF